MAMVQEGQTATNPKTGQKIIFQGGQWRNAGGAAPARKSTSIDTKQAEDARIAASGARDQIRAMGHLYDMATKYPGGIPQAAGDAALSGVGSAAPNPQAYRLFDAMANRAAMGQAKSLTPVSNTDIKLLKDSGPNPSLRSENNHALIDMDYPSAARNLFTNKAKANWVEKWGSLTAKTPRGRTFEQALSEGLSRPAVRAAMRPPSAMLGGRSTGVARVNSDEDFARLPSGTIFMGPDGQRRRKP